MNVLASNTELTLPTEELIRATGVSEASLKEYLRLNLIVPAYPSKGKRQRNGFSFANAIQTKIIKVLSEADIQRSLIGPISYFLTNSGMIHIRNPLSLDFLSDVPSNNRGDREQKVILKIVHCGTFYKVGYVMREIGKKSEANSHLGFVCNFIKKSGNGFKKLFPKDLTDAEVRRMTAENISINLTLNGIHHEVKSRLKSMGLL